MSNNMAKIAEARKTVEQLKLEVNIDRMKVLGQGREQGGDSGPAVCPGLCRPGAIVQGCTWEEGWARGGAGQEEGPGRGAGQDRRRGQDEEGAGQGRGQDEGRGRTGGGAYMRRGRVGGGDRARGGA